ncbi:hypothetical protein M9458_033353, partial [Cirrhinus mrigala]
TCGVFLRGPLVSYTTRHNSECTTDRERLGYVWEWRRCVSHATSLTLGSSESER